MVEGRAYWRTWSATTHTMSNLPYISELDFIAPFQVEHCMCCIEEIHERNKGEIHDDGGVERAVSRTSVVWFIAHGFGCRVKGLIIGVKGIDVQSWNTCEPIDYERWNALGNPGGE